ALFRNYRRHRMLHAKEVRRQEPLLRSTGLRAGTLYYDCMTDDARLVVETAVDAVARGAIVGTHLEVTAFRRDALGRVIGVAARDMLHEPEQGKKPEEVLVRARVTIAAAGPWTDELLKLVPGQRTLLRPTKGVHLVLSRERLPIDHAIVLAAVRDARVLFAIPWGPRTIVGTTDTDDAGSPDACEANAWDVDYLLETANHYFPKLAAREEDVISTWAGLRPLMAAQAERASDVSREHEILDVAPGLLTIAGGKLTTYRLMAEQAVDRVVRKIGVRSGGAALCATETTPLPGASDPDALADLPRAAERLARARGLPEDVARHLICSYGLRANGVLEAGQAEGASSERLVPDLPYVWAEVAFSVRQELAQRLDDVLRRRTLVFLKDRDQGLSVAEPVAALMARLLSWDRDRQEAEVRRYRDLVSRSRAYLTRALPSALAGS
ncbi:glycerol-3-phosphate dehydrogenase/oxidase, partial [bacterium]|nr:glycerol-3-phosphate dehydrogenase/oxidase [bacterium]